MEDELLMDILRLYIDPFLLSFIYSLQFESMSKYVQKCVQRFVRDSFAKSGNWIE